MQGGYKVSTRSELVAACFELVCMFADSEGVNAKDTNHAALQFLEQHGIEWPVKTYQKDLMQVLAWDTNEDMSMGQLLHRMGEATQLHNMQKQSEDDGAPDVAEDEDLARELEELDQQLRRADDM